ncbi:MAG: hypothetical protein ACRDYV_17915, partial [Acidimicrobiia bacterium]
MTSVLSPIEFDHLVQVVRHRACGWRAECWCGWNSAWCDDYVTADEAGQDHREVAAGPPDGLDAALSGLLDLQDDLAATVMWLAEHWSADLPAPDVYSHTQYRENGEALAAVRLLVYCDSTDGLVRVAKLLGEPVVADAE